ncbi:sugar phosphate exchanger 3-like [Glandiceps talaboti]
MAAPSEVKAAPKQRWTIYHATVFLLTFFSYSLFHANRKTFSNVKTSLQSEWTPSFHNSTILPPHPDKIWNNHCLFETDRDAETFLGILDSIFLFSYAVGLFISGILGDRFDLRKVLAFGMCSSAVMVFIFGCISEWFSIYNKAFYVIFWILNGLLQSTGWPAVVAVMGNWFGKSSRGVIFGLWSACASVGNIFGTLMAASVLDYGYEYAFLFTSTVLFAAGIVVFFGLVPTPKDVGLPVADEDVDSIQIKKEEPEPTMYEVYEDEENDDKQALLGSSASHVSQERPKAIGFIQAFCLPGVLLFALSYACLKLVNYSFFFWLPFYLNKKFNWPEKVADEISIFYDVGGIIGGTIAGVISDRMRTRSPVLITMLVLSLGALYGYSVSPDNKHVNAVLMTVAGFFVGGVANLISAAVAADLGRQDQIRGSKEALATVTGIIDGTGSMGAALGQVLVPLIQEYLSWQWVFYLFLLMTFLTILCILPLFIKDIMAMNFFCQRRRHLTIQNDDTIGSLNRSDNI